MTSTLFSPVNIWGYVDNGDVHIIWTRRSRIPGLEVDNWTSQYWTAPLDDIEERYEVDILNGSTVVRTIYVVGEPWTIYDVQDQLSDFGSLQTVLSVTVYQIDRDQGRGSGRTATIQTAAAPNHNTLTDELGHPLTSGWEDFYAVDELGHLWTDESGIPLVGPGSPMNSVPPLGYLLYENGRYYTHLTG